MNQAEKDTLRAFVIDLLAARPQRNGPRHRGQVAAYLHALAEEIAPGVGHGIGGPPGHGVRWTGRDLLIGKVLWEAVGKPRRVHIDIAGMTTRIVPDSDGEYLVSTNRAQRVSCIRAWHIGQWAKGWRPGWIEGCAICFDIEAMET